MRVISLEPEKRNEAEKWPYPVSLKGSATFYAYRVKLKNRKHASVHRRESLSEQHCLHQYLQGVPCT